MSEIKKMIVITDCMECPKVDECNAWKKLTPKQKFTLKIGVGICKFILKNCPLEDVPIIVSQCGGKQHLKKISLGVVVQRTIGFPFFVALAFVGAMAMWIKWVWNFAKHGGEAIAYTDKINRKTIQDVFQKLSNEKNIENK